MTKKKEITDEELAATKPLAFQSVNILRFLMEKNQDPADIFMVITLVLVGLKAMFFVGSSEDWEKMMAGLSEYVNKEADHALRDIPEVIAKIRGDAYD